MSQRQLTIGVLCGGQSAEHEVSLHSAKNILAALDPKRYRPLLLVISKRGQWFLVDDSRVLDGSAKWVTRGGQPVVLLPGGQGRLVFLRSRKSVQLDIVFPIVHGPGGEDGTVQGLLKLAGVPFVGAGVLGSAVGMDKEIMKRLLKEAGLPIGKFLVSRVGEKAWSFTEVKKRLGCPFFIKPANLGSSVGISKVKNQAEYQVALTKALSYDNKILLEEYIQGREIECAVLGNEQLSVSCPGEIKPKHDFYSYEAKYIDDQGADLLIPAPLSKKQSQNIKALAVKTFQALDCAGLGRVDFFLKADGTILVNEINTLPGFTNISMYPKLWAESGVPAGVLLDKLISLAVEKFQAEKNLQ